MFSGRGTGRMGRIRKLRFSGKPAKWFLTFGFKLLYFACLTDRRKFILSDRDDVVTIYTDGGCDPNPGVGGWGAILIYGGSYKELSGGELCSTNNRMEMTAAIKALEALKRKCKAIIYTDSEYLQKGITQWLPGWKRRNWRRKGGEIKNLDLWRRLDELAQAHDVEWRWVRGHTGNIHNERCDSLAGEEIGKLRARCNT